MSSQSVPTIGQATTIRKDGGAEFVTHDASIQPDRYTFANFDELNADGAQSVTFGDPVLDAIFSAAAVLKSGSGRWLISSGGTAPWETVGADLATRAIRGNLEAAQRRPVWSI